MANSTTHLNWFGPIRKARHTILITYLDADGDPTDPTTPDTEVSKDGGTFADCAEEATTVTGSNGTAFITLTGAETDCLALAVAAKVASGPKNTIATGPVKDYPIFATGTATAGAAGTITLAVGSVPIDDFYNGFIIRTTGGTGGGGTGGANNQARMIVDYNGATRVATIGPANWETNPDATTTYDLLRTEWSMNATLNNGSHGGSSAIVSLQQLTVTQTSSNTAAVTFTGNGTGAGLSLSGGATGPGALIAGGGTSGNGITISATSGHGVQVTGAGAGNDGMRLTGGNAVTTSAAGHGLNVIGGTASSSSGGTAGRGLSATGGASAGTTNSAGVGLYGTSGANNGAGGSHGMQVVGVASGNAFYALAVNGSAMRIEAAGPGMNIISSGNYGITSTGGIGGLYAASTSAGSHGVTFVAAAGAGSAFFCQGGTNGLRIDGSRGIYVTSSGGDAILAEAVSGHGMSLLGNGTSKHGLLVTGGTAGTSDGLSCVAGTGGVPIRGNITGSITGNLSGSVGSVSGAVGSVTSGVTVTTNNDKTGYSLTQSFPTNFASLAISAGGVVDSNVTQFGGVAGTFALGRPETNMTHIAGSSVSTSTAQLGVNVVNFGGAAGTFSAGVPAVNTTQFGGVAGTFSGGRPEVNLSHIAGAAVNTSSAQLGVNVVNAAGTAWGSGAITAASIASGAIASAKFAADTGLQSIRANTAQAGAAGSITLDASASATTDFYAGALIRLTGGTGAGQARLCTAYNGSTKVATVVPNWATNPDATSTFAILSQALTNANLTHISGAAVATGTAQLGVNVVNWGGTAVASANVRANIIQINSAALNTASAQLGVNLVNIAGAAVSTSTAQLGVNVVNFGGAAGTFSGGRPEVNTSHWGGTAVASAVVTANTTQWGGTAVASANVNANVTQFGGLAGTFSGGRAEVNMSHIAGAAVNTSSAQLGVNVVNAAGTAWNSGAIGASTLASDTLTAAKIADGAIDRATFAADTGLQTIRSGTAQAGGAGSITLDAGASAVDGYYVGYWVYTTGGTGSGQCRAITGYTGATKVATINIGWSVTPDNTTTFAIMPVAQVHADVRYFNGAEFPNDGSGAPMVTAGAWYGDGQANTFLSDGTGSPLPRVATSGWYDAANNQAYSVDLVDNGSGDYFPSVNTKLWAGAAAQTAVSGFPKVDLAGINGDTGFVPNLNGFLEEGTINGSPIPANVTHVTGTSIVGSNDVGAAFKTFFDVSTPTLTQNSLGTQVGAIKTVTDKLDTMMEVDGLVYRLTTNALEQAPTGGSAPTASAIADEVQTRTLLANLVQIDSASITGGNGSQMAAAFVSFFDVVSPVLTTASVNQTGDSFARIGSNGTGLTAVPWNAAWDTEVQSEVEDGLNALGFTTTVSGRIDAAVSSRSTLTASGVWSNGTRTLTSAANITSSGQSISVNNGNIVSTVDMMVIATISAVTNAKTFTLNSGTTDDNAYVGCLVQVRRSYDWEQVSVGVCTAFDGATRRVTLQNDLAFSPATNDKVFIFAAQDQNAAKLAVSSTGGVTLADTDHGGVNATISARGVFFSATSGAPVNINTTDPGASAVSIGSTRENGGAVEIINGATNGAAVYLGGTTAGLWAWTSSGDKEIAIGGSLSMGTHVDIRDALWSTTDRTLTDLTGLTVDANVTEWAGQATQTDVNNKPLVSTGWWAAAGGMTAAEVKLSSIVGGDVLPRVDMSAIGGDDDGVAVLNDALTHYMGHGFHVDLMAIAGSSVGGALYDIGPAFRTFFDVDGASLTVNTLDTRTSTTNTNVSSFVTPIADMGSVAAKLDTMIEADGPLWKYTAASLAEAPTGGGGGGPTAAEIADAVWDEATASHTTSGTFGKRLQDSSTLDATGVWSHGTRTVTAATNITSNGGTITVSGGVAAANLEQWGGQTAEIDAYGHLKVAVAYWHDPGSNATYGVNAATTGHPKIDVEAVDGSTTGATTLASWLAANRLDVAVSSRAASFTLPTNFSSLSINGSGHVTVGGYASGMGPGEQVIYDYNSNPNNKLFVVAGGGVYVTTIGNDALAQVTSAVPSTSAIWSAGSRTLTGTPSVNVIQWRSLTPGNLDSNGFVPANAAAVNGNTTRADTLSTWLDANRLDVSVGSRLASAGYTTPPTAASIADAVWDEPKTDHTTSGTFGYYVDARISTVGGSTLTAADVWAHSSRSLTDKAGFSLSDPAVAAVAAASAATIVPHITTVGNAVAAVDTALDSLATEAAATTNKEAILDAVNTLAQAGDGSVSVDHNYGAVDAWRVLTDPPSQVPISGVNVTVYRTADYTAGRRSSDYVIARSKTGSDGRWLYPVMLDPGEYTLVFSKNGAVISESASLTVE